MGKKLQKKKKKNGRKRFSNKNNQHTGGFESEFDSVLIDSSQLIPIEAEEKEDRISDLPDDLLRHIISLIPYDSDSESEGETRLLSTRWWDFWNRTTVQHEDGSIYAMAISTLRFVASSIDWRKPLNCPRKLVFHSHGSGQVLVATMAKYKKLHLDFSHGHDNDDSVNWWASLWLMLSYLPCPHSSIIPPILSIRLTSVNLPSNGIDIVSSLLLNIPSLHTIEIRESKGLCDINVSLDDKKRLRYLSIIDCQVNSIKIKGPGRLRSFHYRGRCPSIMEIEMTSFFGIYDFMLDLREGPLIINDPFKNLLKILPYLNAARYMTMCQWTFEAMIRPVLYSYAQFKFLTELWWIDNSMDEENIESLITFLKECPLLEKLFVTTDPTCYYLPSSGRRKRGRPKCREQSELSYLKLVRMDGFEHEEDELLLADRIFNIANRELTVLATSRRPYVRRLVKVHPNWPRMFVKDNDSLILKAHHVHMSV